MDRPQGPASDGARPRAPVPDEVVERTPTDATPSPVDELDDDAALDEVRVSAATTVAPASPDADSSPTPTQEDAEELLPGHAATVVVPVANPATAGDLLRLAVAMCEVGGTVVALSVALDDAGTEASRSLSTKLRSAVDEVVADPRGREVELVARPAPSVARGVLDAARESGADLLVLGIPVADGDSSLLGPVAESVIDVAPCDVLLAQERTTGEVAGLGMLIIAGAVAGTVSAPFWGWLGDRSSRLVIAGAATLAGLLGILTWVLADSAWLTEGYVHALIFLVLNVAHNGVRLGRKVYLVDLANQDNRAAMVAVSNTVIGVAMLGAGTVGILADLVGTADVILALALLSLVAAAYALRLPEVTR